MVNNCKTASNDGTSKMWNGLNGNSSFIGRAYRKGKSLPFIVLTVKPF